MREKTIKFITKYTEIILPYIPLALLLLFTKIDSYKILFVNNDIIRGLLDLLSNIYPIGPYIFILMALLLTLYILFIGSQKQKIIMIITIIGGFLTYNNSMILKDFKMSFKTELLFISLYLLGILYPISLYNYFQKLNFDQIEKKVRSSLNIFIIIIIFNFIFAYLTDTFTYSYYYSQAGFSGWYIITNGIGHSLLFLLPLYMIYYIKDSNYKSLLYIIAITVIGLLIGTKAFYFSLIATLLLTTIYFIYTFFKNKNIQIFKMVPIIVILFTVFMSHDSLPVSTNIDLGIKDNMDEYGNLNVLDFTLKGRNETANIIKEDFDNSNLIVKTFGMGLYYPKYNFAYVELDYLDLLISRGVYGTLLYLSFIFFGLITVFTNVKNKFKKVDKTLLLFFLLTLGYIFVASMFVGHVIFDMVTLNITILLLMFYYFKLEQES